MNWKSQFWKKNKKKTENQRQNAASENKKPQAKNLNWFLQKKTMNGLENHFKNIRSKKSKKL